MSTATTIASLCARLNRAPIYVRGLQRRFGLPIREGVTYIAPYIAFLENIILLRALGITEETLLHLWDLERKLMQLLHADSTGSPTWFLDACGATDNPDHRLLLSNFDIGAYLPKPAPPSIRARLAVEATPSPATIQLGLNFSGKKTTPELFTAPEMGEDAILVFRQYLTLHQEIVAATHAEIPVLCAAVNRFRPGIRYKPRKPRYQPNPKPKTGLGTFVPGEI